MVDKTNRKKLLAQSKLAEKRALWQSLEELRGEIEWASRPAPPLPPFREFESGAYHAPLMRKITSVIA